MIILGELTGFNLITIVISIMAICSSIFMYVDKRRSRISIYFRIIWKDSFFKSSRLDEVTFTEELACEKYEYTFGIELINTSEFPISVDRVIMLPGKKVIYTGRDIWKIAREISATPFPISIEDSLVPVQGARIFPLDQSLMQIGFTEVASFAIRFTNGHTEIRDFTDDEIECIKNRFQNRIVLRLMGNEEGE